MTCGHRTVVTHRSTLLLVVLLATIAAGPLARSVSAQATASYHDTFYLGGGYGAYGGFGITRGLFLYDGTSNTFRTLLQTRDYSYGFQMDADNRRIVFTATTYAGTSTLATGPQAGLYRFDPVTSTLETLAGPNTLLFYRPYKVVVNQDGDWVLGVHSLVPRGTGFASEYAVLKVGAASRSITTLLTSARLGRPARFTHHIGIDIDTGDYLVVDDFTQTAPSTLRNPVIRLADDGTVKPWHSGRGQGWFGLYSGPQNHRTGDLEGPQGQHVYQLKPGSSGRTTIGTVAPPLNGKYFSADFDLQTAAAPRWISLGNSSYHGMNRSFLYVIDRTAMTLVATTMNYLAGTTDQDFDFYRGRHLQTVSTGTGQWDIRLSCPRFPSKPYVLVAGISGVRPGIPLPSKRHINLNLDLIVDATFNNRIPTIFHPGPGVLDSNGEAVGKLNLRPLGAPLPLGIPVWIACAVLDAKAPDGIAYLPDTYVIRP